MSQCRTAESTHCKSVRSADRRTRPRVGVLYRAGPPLEAATSLPPDISDPLVSDRSVDDGVRDRAMAHEGLQRPRI
jgi:hypothetical protein